MNIWHDIEPERIYPTDFTAHLFFFIAVWCILRYEKITWTRKPVCCLWTECCSLQRIIP